MKYVCTLPFLAVFAAARLAALEAPVLTSEEAVRQALDSYPQLGMARDQVAAALGTLRATGQLPNPNVSYGFESLDRAGVGTGEWTVGAEIALQDLWRRGPHRRGAEARLSAQKANVERVAAELRLQTLRAYIAAHAASRSARALQGLMGILGDVARVAHVRMGEYDLSEYDVRRVELEVQRISRAIDEAQLAESESLSQLSLLTGIDVDSLRGYALHVEFPFPAPGDPPEALVGAALAARAEVQVANSRRDGARADVDALERARWPSLGLGLGYKEEKAGASGVTGMVTVEVPLFDRLQGELDRGRALHRRAGLEEESVRARIEVEVLSAHARVTSLAGRLAELPEESEVISMMATARQRYEEGDSDLLTLIDAARTLTAEIEFRWELRRDYQISYYELERAIGTPLSEATQEAHAQ